MSQFKGLDASFSKWRPDLNPGEVRVVFVVNKATLGEAFLPVRVVLVHYHSNNAPFMSSVKVKHSYPCTLLKGVRGSGGIPPPIFNTRWDGPVCTPTALPPRKG